MIRAVAIAAGKRDGIRLLDDTTFETTTRYELEANEGVTAVSSGSLADDPAAFYFVGTAVEEPDEQEPKAVSLPLRLICRLWSRASTVCCACPTVQWGWLQRGASAAQAVTCSAHMHSPPQLCSCPQWSSASW